MFTDFIQFGGVIFWSVAAFFFIAMVLADSTDSYGWVFCLFLLFVSANVLFGNAGHYAASHPYKSLAGLGIYLVLGIAWTFPAWILFLRKVGRSYLEIKTKFAQEKGFVPQVIPGCQGIDEKYRDRFVDALYWINPNDSGLKYIASEDKLAPPTFAHNQWRFWLWAVAWPISIVNSILGDFMREALYYLRDVYNNISISIFNKV